MNDLISRQAAIDAVHKEFDDCIVWDESGMTTANEVERILDSVPSAQPDLDEWCKDCKEYDKEKHCCPRFNRVIREALKDTEPEIIYCKDCVKHNIGDDDTPYKSYVCPLVKFRGKAQGHEFDYQYCVYGVRKT